jgi:uncharacterized OB-fold protein
MSEPSFTISENGKAITCRKCGKTSHNPNDVAHHYCGQCRVFHDVPELAGEAELIEATRDKAKELAAKLPPDVRFAVLTWQPPVGGLQKRKMVGTTFASNVKDHGELLKVLTLLLAKLEEGLPRETKWE